VVPSGGTTIVVGIGERMTKELTALVPSTMKSRWLHHQSASTLSGLVVPF